MSPEIKWNNARKIIQGSLSSSSIFFAPLISAGSPMCTHNLYTNIYIRINQQYNIILEKNHPLLRTSNYDEF